MNKASTSEIFRNNIQNKITSYINNELQGDYKEFETKYQNYKIFSQSFHLDNIISHQFNFTEKDYIQILNNLKTYYSVNEQLKRPNEITISHQKVKKKLPAEKKIAGFVDILIISLLTGSFIGIILLNIYSKIIENI